MYKGLFLTVSVFLISGTAQASFTAVSDGVSGSVLEGESLYSVQDVLSIGDNVKFENNQLVSSGKTIKKGTVLTTDEATKVTIGDGVEFRENQNLNGLGGVIYNGMDAEITFEGAVHFIENSSSSSGAAVYNNGIINFNGDSFWKGNKSGDNLLDISNGNTVKFNSGTAHLDSGISGGIVRVNGGVLDIGTGKLDVQEIHFEKGTTLALDINDVDDYGQITAKRFSNTGAKLKATIAQGVFDKAAEHEDGLSFQLISGPNQDEFVNDFSNAMYRFEGDGSGKYTIQKVATASDIAGQGNPSLADAAGAWTDEKNDFTLQNQKEMAEYLNELAQNNPEAYQKALGALAPEITNKVQFAVNENTNQVFGAVSSRFTGGCGFYCSGAEGFSSGDELFQHSMTWVQGLYNKSELNRENGFDAESSGVAMGFEHYLDTDVKLGGGYAYTGGDVDSQSRTTDIESHTLFVYGEYKPSQWFVNGILGYTFSDYEEKGYNGNQADFDVNSISWQVMGGYDLNYEYWTITPQVGVRYTNFDKDGYQDAYGQEVSGGKSDVLTFISGVKTSYEYLLDNDVRLRPEVKMAVTYDVVNDSAASTVLLSNGSSYVVNNQALDRFGIETGLGLAVGVADDVEFSLGYEGKFREDYKDNTGLLSLKYKF